MSISDTTNIFLSRLRWSGTSPGAACWASHQRQHFRVDANCSSSGHGSTSSPSLSPRCHCCASVSFCTPTAVDTAPSARYHQPVRASVKVKHSGLRAPKSTTSKIYRGHIKIYYRVGGIKCSPRPIVKHFLAQST
jgi:hypothetical protein